MRFPCILLIMVFVVPASAYAWELDPIRKSDWVRHGVLTGLMIIDWRQTLQNGSDFRYYELNPALGKYPSKGAINTYFAVSYCIKTLTTYLLPHDWRKKFQYGMIGISVICVGRNFQIGLGGKW